MGTIRNGGNGAFSGKAGSFIGSNFGDRRYRHHPGLGKQNLKLISVVILIGVMGMARYVYKRYYSS